MIRLILIAIRRKKEFFGLKNWRRDSLFDGAGVLVLHVFLIEMMLEAFRFRPYWGSLAKWFQNHHGRVNPQ
jgi:hypothetical protein